MTIERDGDCLVLRGEAVIVVRSGCFAELTAVQALREEAMTLLGRAVPTLSHLCTDVQRLYELLDGSQAAGVARVPMTDETPTLLRAVLHRIQEDLALCVAANELRLRLGATLEEILPRARQLEAVAAELRRHVGEASRPRTLREWIEAESSPRLELLRKACKTFLDSGVWLKLGGEVKAWKKLDLDANVHREAEAMSRYCRIDSDRLLLRVEGFALFAESAPYLDRVLSLIRLGIERFLQGANLEPDQRQQPAVTAEDLAAIASDMPVEQLVRFVDHLSCLGGVYCLRPFSWTPDRGLLRYYPAANADDLVAIDGLGARKHGTAEECLWLLRVVADIWLATRTWPTLDALLADSRVGPQFAPALESIAYTLIKSPDHRLATLDLDGLILGASNSKSLVQTVASIIGTLADKLEAEQRVSVADIARLTGVDAEFVRHLLPMLDRPDLGLFVRGVSTGQIEAEMRLSLAEYLGVRSGDELAARWFRNRERHPEFPRASDGQLLNVFGVKTFKDRLRALGARGRDLGLADVESSTLTDHAGSAVLGRDRLGGGTAVPVLQAGSVYGTSSTQDLVSMGGAGGDTEQALDKRLAGSTSEDSMSNLTPEQQRVVDAVVTVLLEQPGSGRQWVSGSELRFALKDLERQHRNEVIQSCVPRLLLVPPGQDDSYQPTLDGLLEAADSRTTRALEIALRLISDRYAQASGRRQRALLWSDVRKQGAFERGDFDVVWYTLTLGQVAHAGRPPVGASNDPRSPRYDYEFWLREQDLELIYENRDIHAWAAVQRARIAAMMLPHEATLSSSRSVLTETPKLPATVHSQTAIGTSAWTPESARSKVDIGILTIRDDEFRAVLAVFPSKAGTHKGTSREYTLRHADAGNGERYTVAVLRLVEQGHGEAQDAARDLIDDLAPRLVLVVGIAGGLPSDDVTLGDVVISTRIHDFTIEARKSGQEPTYAVTGGPIAKALAAVVTNLAAREDELGSWTADLPSRPAVTWTREGQLYGSAEWQHELREKLEHHHGEGSTPRAPVYAAGPIASSDRLVKDPELLIPWLQTARNLLAIEMESGGVYRAVRERCPMLAIRGISDIVGLKRADAWTKFACASAAAFTRAFLRTRPIEVGSSTSAASSPP